MPNSKTVLIVDDDPDVRRSLSDILTPEGYRCTMAKDGKEALDCLDDALDLVLLDIHLPRVDGMDVLKKSIALTPDLPVVIISGLGTIQLAVSATKLGAYDFLEKPLEKERVLLTVKNAIEKRLLKIQRDRLLTENRNRYRMIGYSSQINEIFALIDQAAKVDSKVLICGENGTGKELVARAIHDNSARSGFRFVPVNCSAIPEGLIETELFGHKKGAFTSAMTDRAGKFHVANRGTLFLDEIGDMSLMMQAKILRVIEDGHIMPVGSDQPSTVDVRIIAATNKDLEEEIEKGNFRQDLFFRLNVIPIYLPPLRERKGDIRYLSDAFLKEFCENNGLSQKSFTQNVWPILMEAEWSGNVRELRNVIERIAVMTTDTIIDAPDVIEAMKTKPAQTSLSKTMNTLRQARAKFEKEYIIKMLAMYNGKIQETADALGIRRTHLWKKMKLYDIS